MVGVTAVNRNGFNNHDRMLHDTIQNNAGDSDKQTMLECF